MLYGREDDFTSVTNNGEYPLFMASEEEEDSRCAVCKKRVGKWAVTIPWLTTMFGISPTPSFCGECLADLGHDLLTLSQQ